MLKATSAKGTCRVISFSPDHSLTLPQLEVAAIEKVIEVWAKEFRTISNDTTINYIQIFENKSEIMGSCNPHPHGQIWAQNSLPVEIIKETAHQKKYFERSGVSLLGDYLNVELARDERIVLENEHFVALVPFWAVWPFETMIISKRHVQMLEQLLKKNVSLMLT
jgi:UDPglucose--hexose-1-phosphate uridylyltransferase